MCYIISVCGGGYAVIPSPEGRRSMMKLAQRMMTSFCANVSASTTHRWTTLSGANDDGVRVATRKSTDPGQPNGVVLCAATSLWLPVPPHRVFDFFRDEHMRAEVLEFFWPWGLSNFLRDWNLY